MAHMTVQASKWSPSLSVSTTASTGVINTAIPASAITASVAASSGTTTAAITYMVYGPSASAPGACTTTPGGLWAQVGTITPNGNGSYNPNVGYTPTSTGTYWYYAAYPGDTTNNAATSTCSAAMAKTVVSTPPDTFGFSAIGSQTAGHTVHDRDDHGAALRRRNRHDVHGVKTLTFTGPSTSPKGNVPTYPATVTFVNGIATNVSITLYNAQTTTLTATQGLITGASNSFTVAAGATAGFTIDTVGTQTAGTAFGVTVHSADAYGNSTSDNGVKSLSWTTSPGNSPNGTAPTLNAGTATSVNFVNGMGIPTGLVLVNASGSSTLTVTQVATAKTGTSASFTVNAAAASKIAFINCTLPSARQHDVRRPAVLDGEQRHPPGEHRCEGHLRKHRRGGLRPVDHADELEHARTTRSHRRR